MFVPLDTPKMLPGIDRCWVGVGTPMPGILEQSQFAKMAANNSPACSCLYLIDNKRPGLSRRVLSGQHFKRVGTSSTIVMKGVGHGRRTWRPSSEGDGACSTRYWNAKSKSGQTKFGCKDEFSSSPKTLT